MKKVIKTILVLVLALAVGLSVVACGAGAISKQVFSNENRIERYANLRDVKLYLENFEEREQKKANFFKNWCLNSLHYGDNLL